MNNESLDIKLLEEIRKEELKKELFVKSKAYDLADRSDVKLHTLYQSLIHEYLIKHEEVVYHD